MNKIAAPEYLSLKKITFLSLVISLGFHLIMGLAFFFSDSLFFSATMRLQATHTFNIWRFLFFWSFSFIMVFLILAYSRKIMCFSYKNKHTAMILIILGSIILTSTLSIGFTFCKSAFSPIRHDYRFIYNVLKDGLVRDISMMVVVILVMQLMKSQHDQKTIAVENETLRSENILTRFEALKSQLNPHFLFNSLNTLQSLIVTDPAKAENYMQQLSAVLRNTLQNKEVTTLEDEMNCVNAYCEMMQIRYGENLRFEFKIDARYNKYMVLPLSLQSLVENSVKHNVITSKQPLVVTIATGDDYIAVSNPIQPKISPEEGNGIGLVNLTERYKLKWNRKVEITNDGLTFCVKLPLVLNN